jgi:hypothetical protein
MYMLKPPVRPGLQPPLAVPQLSPKAYVEQIVGVMHVSVTYSRVNMKGRKIFGGLVPHGQVWRFGANEPTLLSISDPARLEEHELAAGMYALYAIPGETAWTIIVNRKIVGFGMHDAAEDVLRFTVPASQTPTSVESFTIGFADVTTDAAAIEFAWEKTAVKFRIAFDVNAKVLPAIQKAMENPMADVAGMYHQSAAYYLSIGKELPQALEWINKSLELNDAFYFVWRVKALIQAGLKDYAGAIATAEIARSKAVTAGNNQMAGLLAEAIEEWKKKVGK